MTAIASPPPAIDLPTHQPLRAAAPLGDNAWDAIRKTMMLRHCKWDPHVGDQATLSPFPLLLASSAWQSLAELAESAAAELIAAERELVDRPDLHRRLGIRREVSRALTVQGMVPRILRFDFHSTPAGWRISEVNSDVPGGYTESSDLPRLMAGHYRQARAAGDVAAAWTDAIAAAADGGDTVAMLHAPGFLEDLQVVAYLADHLAERGLDPVLAHPRQVDFHDGRASLQLGRSRVPLGAIVRFFQAEWLASRRVTRQWRAFFGPCRTPIVNSPSAILTESKRFPLIWQALWTKTATWRAILPETRGPWDVPWDGERWLAKTAYCNTGDSVCIREMMRPGQWRWNLVQAHLFPRQWIAQRRFATTA
ncbi:MAG TPA: glutathionylspermidine synthase family protein, partial [Tepidisphaeraceae bacterium]|nr:glutathionylspermidine synthase family protein [Tepidisphaeraceae bacterium]